MNSKQTNPVSKEIAKLFKKARALGWTVDHESDDSFYFGKSSPAGQDFGVSVDTAGDGDQFLRNLKEVWEDFDVSQETYLWLNETGHGRNGAPYDMKDVYEDMESCESALEELFNALHDCLYA